jgi:hypothetical protein
MLFADYQLLVLQEYERRKAVGDLSHRMLHLTPGRLKEECKAVCNQRYDRKDEKTLEDFFGPGGDKAAWLKVLKGFETDKFRPLVNFLRGSTSAPDPKNVELLAWLIDYNPRPHEFGRIYNTNSAHIPDMERDKLPKNSSEKEEEAGSAEESVQNRKNETPAPGISPKPAPGFGKRKIIMAAIILAIAIAGIYGGWRKSATDVMTGPQGCMYWAGDHYQQVSCGQKLGDTLVIALDPEKLNYFKKITRPDTITENSIGRLWCVRFNGNYEFYTSGGFHPINQGLRLKPLTDFIIRKYIHPGQDIEQTPK